MRAGGMRGEIGKKKWEKTQKNKEKTLGEISREQKLKNGKKCRGKKKWEVGWGNLREEQGENREKINKGKIPRKIWERNPRRNQQGEKKIEERKIVEKEN